MKLAQQFLNQIVTIKVDRALGSIHPKWNFLYPVNYGYLEGVTAPDGEFLDAYVLNLNQPVQEFEGHCVAIIHREDDDDDKLIIIPQGTTISDLEIEKQTEFQEQWFKHSIIRTA